jgi:hypothetical protein
MMKKIVINTLILGVIELFAQDISCVEFATMSDIEATKYATQFKQDIQIISEDDSRKNRTEYLDKNYQKTRHRYKCILFRDAKTSSVEDFKRVKALAQLNKETLEYNEKSLYNHLVVENKRHLSGVSNASLVKSDICSYPLLYLSSQSTNKGLLVYEKRLVNNKIETFSRYVNIPLQMQCGTTELVQNNYLKYLNKKGAKLPLIVPKENISTNIYNKLKQAPKERINSDEIIQGTFIVTKKFKAINFQSAKKRTFKVGMLISFKDLEAENGDKLFEYQGKTYRVVPYTWKNSTREKE